MPDKYYITINGEKVSVSEEVYTTYRQMRRHERTLTEKDARNYVVKYEDFSTGEMSGEEQIYDPMQLCLEDIVLSKLIYRKLHAMTTAELNQYLENIAKLIEATANSPEAAAEIVRDSKINA